jgi:hypothetical protein
MTLTKMLSSHCRVGDTKCLEQRQDIEKTIVLPINKLMTMLESTVENNNGVQKLLDELNVPRVDVTYEKLYYAENAEEWMKSMRFLGVGLVQGLTLDTVKQHMKLAPTSIGRDLNKRIANYDQVKAALTSTKYEQFLS